MMLPFVSQRAFVKKKKKVQTSAWKIFYPRISDSMRMLLLSYKNLRKDWADLVWHIS